MEVEGPIGDETSVMSVDMDRASDMESVAHTDEVQRILHDSKTGKTRAKNYDRTMTLVRALLEAGCWDQVLPRYEKQVLLVATSSERNWQHFLEATGTPASQTQSTNISNAAQASPTSSSTKKTAATASSKTQKASSRSKRGTTTPRRRGADVDTSDQPSSDSLQEPPLTSRDHIETLHTRLRTLIFDTLVDEVLFPHERHLDRVPLKDSIKEGSRCTFFHLIILGSYFNLP